MSEELEQLGQSLEGIPIPQAQIASAGLEIAGEVAKEAEQFGEAIAHSAGLTREEGYEGWFPTAILGYEFVGKPLYSILLGLDATLQSIQNWLNGAGKDLSWLQKDIEQKKHNPLDWKW